MPPTDEPRLGPETSRRLGELTNFTLQSSAAGEFLVSDKTQSMAPLLWGGESLQWRRAERGPRWGDVVLFLFETESVRAEGPGVIAHRVIWRRSDGVVVTKGDNRPDPDRERVRPEQIFGVAVGVRRANSVVDLTGGGPRLYAVAAAGWSVVGAVLHAIGAALDAVPRKLVPGWGDRRLWRAAAWGVQRLGRRALHALLYRPCHREQEV